MTNIYGIVPYFAISSKPATVKQLVSEIRKLDLFFSFEIAAKLNTVISKEPTDVFKPLESLILDSLIDPKSLERLARFTAKESSCYLALLGRQSIVEFYRALSLYGKSCRRGEALRKKRHLQQALIRSLILSYELSARELQDFWLDNVPSNRLTDSSLPAIRALSLYAPISVPAATYVGRCELLMDNFFFGLFPKYRKQFEDAVGMTIADYRKCSIAILYVNLVNDGGYKFTRQELCCEFPRLGPFIDQFLKNARCSVSKMSDPPKTSLSFLNFLKTYPLLEANLSTLVLDRNALLEHMLYGPLFRSELGSEKFEDFGTAFEKYVQEDCRLRWQKMGCSMPPICNPAAGQGEVADVILHDAKSVLIVETKSAWLKNEAIEKKSLEDFVELVSERYVRNRKGRPKGIEQLRIAVQAICKGLPNILQIATCRQVFSLLLVHDSHFALPPFGHKLAMQFVRAFELNDVPESGFFNWRGFQIFTPFLASIDDFEMLKQLENEESIFDILRAYSEFDPTRQMSVSHYLDGLPGKATFDSNARQAGLKLILDTVANLR